MENHESLVFSCKIQIVEFCICMYSFLQFLLYAGWGLHWPPHHCCPCRHCKLYSSIIRIVFSFSMIWYIPTQTYTYPKLKLTLNLTTVSKICFYPLGVKLVFNLKFDFRWCTKLFCPPVPLYLSALITQQCSLLNLLLCSVVLCFLVSLLSPPVAFCRFFCLWYCRVWIFGCKQSNTPMILLNTN